MPNSKQAVAILASFFLLTVFVLLLSSSDKIVGLKTQDREVLVDLMTNLAIAMSAGPRLHYNDVFNLSEKHLDPQLFPGSLSQEHNEKIQFKGREGAKERWCGNSAWRDDYAALHVRMRESSLRNETRRFITYSDFVQGLADIMLGIVTTYVVGFLDQRAILINHPCIRSAFDPVQIDWQITPDIPMPLEDNQGAVPYEKAFLNYTTPPEITSTMAQHKGKENVYIASNRGVLVQKYDDKQSPVSILQQKIMGTSILESFGCIFNSMFRVKDEVKKLVAPELDAISKPNARTICIHYRLQDYEAWNPDGSQVQSLDPGVASTIANLLQCAQKLEEYYFPPPLRTSYIIVSNSGLVKEKTKSLLPHKVFASSVAAQHMQYFSSGENKDYACKGSVAEWFLLSQCDIGILPHLYTGFMKTALLSRMKEDMIFALDRCNPGNPVSMQELANFWSFM